MKMMRKTCIFLTIIIFFAAPVVATSTLPAPVPAEKTRWYSVEDIEINIPSDLPTDDFQARFAPSSNSAELRHTGDNPIFLQIEDASDYDGSIQGYPDYRKDDYNEDNEIPNILKFPSIPNYKLVGGKIFEYERGYPSDTNYVAEENNKDWLQIHIKNFSPKIDAVWKKGDGRPDTANVPDPVSFEHKILYWTGNDGQFYDISGTVSFKQNESYNSTAYQDSIDAANRAHTKSLNDSSFRLQIISFFKDKFQLISEYLSW